MTPSKEINYFFDESWKWWMSIDQDTRWHCTWEEFEKLFSDKWIKDTNMEELYRIQDEFKKMNWMKNLPKHLKRKFARRLRNP
jgi:hypothetical protein